MTALLFKLLVIFNKINWAYEFFCQKKKEEKAESGRKEEGGEEGEGGKAPEGGREEG